MMRCGHIVYKVNHLQSAVAEWQAKGFAVEYGRKEKPSNALIYFSEGPYIELLQHTGIPRIVQIISNLLGKRKQMERFHYWDTCDEGLCGLCIEKDVGNLDKEVLFLKEHGIDGLLLNHLKRVDTKGRSLEYKCFFPEGTHFPFLMSYFSIDPKPVDFIHPNGVQKIKRLVFQTDEATFAILSQLVDDDILEIQVSSSNKGITQIEFEQQACE